MKWFKKREQKKDSWTSLAFFVGVALTIRWGAVEAYVIPSGSMLPSILIHDHIFVNKATYGLRVPFSQKWLYQNRLPERGEVVVFRSPEPEGLTLIKRVVGIPGDRIAFDGRNLQINGELVEISKTDSPEVTNLTDQDLENLRSRHEHFQEKLPGRTHSVLQHSDYAGPGFEAFVVPEQSFFVMGDHRDNSRDSRFWGTVPVNNLLGKAEFIWLSCDRQLPVINVFCDPTTMRWSRLGRSLN